VLRRRIVTGIGFIGGGLIFVHGDAVRGLTTAAIVWVTAAIGMACGAGLAILALVVTVCAFVVVFLYPQLAANRRGRAISGSVCRLPTKTGAGSCGTSWPRAPVSGSRSLAFTPISSSAKFAARQQSRVTLELQGQPTTERSRSR
jgi:putative Mg2+ transporter-C (MgtC) family protein